MGFVRCSRNSREPAHQTTEILAAVSPAGFSLSSFLSLSLALAAQRPTKRPSDQPTSPCLSLPRCLSVWPPFSFSLSRSQCFASTLLLSSSHSAMKSKAVPAKRETNASCNVLQTCSEARAEIQKRWVRSQFCSSRHPALNVAHFPFQKLAVSSTGGFLFVCVFCCWLFCLSFLLLFFCLRFSLVDFLFAFFAGVFFAFYRHSNILCLST